MYKYCCDNNNIVTYSQSKQNIKLINTIDSKIIAKIHVITVQENKIQTI
jgi:hypothetical protein